MTVWLLDVHCHLRSSRARGGQPWWMSDNLLQADEGRGVTAPCLTTTDHWSLCFVVMDCGWPFWSIEVKYEEAFVRPSGPEELWVHGRLQHGMRGSSCLTEVWQQVQTLNTLESDQTIFPLVLTLLSRSRWAVVRASCFSSSQNDPGETIKVN